MSVPSSSLVVSLKRKYLRTPRLTPQEPGPRSELRLAIAGLSKTSAPVGGSPNAVGLKTWSPLRPANGSPVTSGRNDGPLKSPTASTKPLPMFPGKTGSQLSQIQNGVKPVPLLANRFQVTSQLPTAASAQPDILLPYSRPWPIGSS